MIGHELGAATAMLDVQCEANPPLQVIMQSIADLKL
jgi:hypothetical protein